VAIYTSWTLLFTVPRWEEMVVAPIYDDDVAAPSVRLAVQQHGQSGLLGKGISGHHGLLRLPS